MNKRIVVISGFSGAGKGTLVRQLLELNRKGTSGFEIVAFCI